MTCNARNTRHKYLESKFKSEPVICPMKQRGRLAEKNKCPVCFPTCLILT